jgi:hypothetical protein
MIMKMLASPTSKLDEKISSSLPKRSIPLPIFGTTKTVACVIFLILTIAKILQNSQNLDTQQLNSITKTVVQNNISVTSMDDDDGYWVRSDEFPPPYTYSEQICNKTYLSNGDCWKATTYCPSGLMNWVYIQGGKPYPRFNATGFLQKMKNKRIMFLGCSLMRQQILALMWTLGYDYIEWNLTEPENKNCTTRRRCFTDEKHNITFCHQFMGTIATKRYHEGNYTLDHSLRGDGDSSCLLEDSNMAVINSFDLVLVQSVAWWTNLGTHLDSPTSPKEWVDKMLPTVYYDAMKELLTKISEKTETVFVLGHIGVDCKEKFLPEPFHVDRIPPDHGWDSAPKFWDTSLHLLLEERLDIKVVDARVPLMQSVHAHPASGYAHPDKKDCLHFCMNSAAVNMYLDLYWNEGIFGPSEREVGMGMTR